MANAPAVAYLLSDAAAHVTGQIVRVDGPRLARMAHAAVLEPVLHRSHWTSDDIERAFASALSPSPVGMAWTAHPASSVDPGTQEFP